MQIRARRVATRAVPALGVLAAMVAFTVPAHVPASRPGAATHAMVREPKQ